MYYKDWDDEPENKIHMHCVFITRVFFSSKLILTFTRRETLIAFLAANELALLIGSELTKVRMYVSN